jgi:hypothetical protein
MVKLGDCGRVVTPKDDLAAACEDVSRAKGMETIYGIEATSCDRFTVSIMVPAYQWRLKWSFDRESNPHTANPRTRVSFPHLLQAQKDSCACSDSVLTHRNVFTTTTMRERTTRIREVNRFQELSGVKPAFTC